MLDYILNVFTAVLGYLEADWYILLAGIMLAVIINVYVDTNKLKKFLQRKAGISIPGAVALGAFTPLCACGTMAVLLSMFVSTMPWGTVMAFLISSPLTSPSEYMFETAFFGSKLATGILAASVILGVLAGVIAHLLEKRTDFFKDQFRLAARVSTNSSCGCSGNDEIAAGCGCEGNGEALKPCSCRPSFYKRFKIDKLIKGFWDIGIKKILLYFIIFIAVGKTVELLIPKEWIMMLFGEGRAYSIPLAATIGLPLYLTDSSAAPLLKSLINSGAGEGAVMAFLIAGKATGVPVIAGMATFLKKRAMAFYIGFIYFGAILAGYLYKLIIG